MSLASIAKKNLTLSLAIENLTNTVKKEQELINKENSVLEEHINQTKTTINRAIIQHVTEVSENLNNLNNLISSNLTALLEAVNTYNKARSKELEALIEEEK